MTMQRLITSWVQAIWVWGFLLAGAMSLLAQSPSKGAAAPPDVAPSPPRVFVRDIYQRRLINETVTVVGVIGSKERDPQSRTTYIYRLTDDFNDTIRVRTDKDIPPEEMRTHHTVTGVVVLGRVKSGERRNELFLVEKRRVRGVGKSPEKRAPKPQQEEEEAKSSFWEDNKVLLAAGGGLLGVAVMLLVAYRQQQARQRQEQEHRARERELERIWARKPEPPRPPYAPERPASAPPYMPTQILEPSASPALAPNGTVLFWGTLEIISGPEQGKKFPLTAPQVTLGRAEGEVRLSQDATVSGNHASIAVQADGSVGSSMDGDATHRRRRQSRGVRRSNLRTHRIAPPLPLALGAGTILAAQRERPRHPPQRRARHATAGTPRRRPHSNRARHVTMGVRAVDPKP
ncbi:MAG: FHA domain-containing protein [Abditibacteriales bacterium]|nr:FHA domain-containing protein [Abditibacteriales bacterium]MDW8365013.1 FHA domain-containing protein [Abditibacteriales bacterium]